MLLKDYRYSVYSSLLLRQPNSVSLKPDRKTADKTAKINSDGVRTSVTHDARPHTTSSAQVPQDRTQDRTDKIATDERHAWPRKVTLDARLRVFTADRTNEPRVVRLFPPAHARRERVAITLPQPQHDWLSVYPTVVHGVCTVCWTSLAVTSDVARTRRCTTSAWALDAPHSLSVMGN